MLYCSFVVVDGTDSYFIMGDGANTYWVMKYDHAAGTITNLEQGTLYNLSSDRGYNYISYDDNDILYFNMEKAADSKNYKQYYSISDDSITIDTEFNIIHQLNQDTSGTAPNEDKFAFDTTKDANNNSKVYQVKKTKIKFGVVQIQIINRNANIKAINDTYIIFDDGRVFKYTDVG